MEMMPDERDIQEALGTFNNYSFKIGVGIKTYSRRQALAISRDIVKFLQKEYPHCTFKKRPMANDSHLA